MTNWWDDVDFDRPEVVARYDELPLWSAPFGQLILDRVPLRPGQTVVDVGCGTGFLAVELAQRCGTSSRVIAVDPWRAALDVLREKCRYLGLANIEVQERDAVALDCASGSVDVVVANLGINNFADPDRVLRECRRVLAPSGSLLMTTNLVGHMAEFYDVFRDTLDALGRTDLVPALESEVAHRATLESVATRLAAAGFAVTETITDSFRMRFATGTALLHHYFVRVGFLPGWRSVVDPPSVDTVFTELEARLNRYATEHGCLELTVPMACVVAGPLA